MNRIVHDIAVIGAGPVGLYAAAWAGEHGVGCLILDFRFHVGGLVSSIYPEKVILDFPGIPEIAGRDITEQLAARCAAQKHDFRLGEHVERLTVLGNEGVSVRTNRGTYSAAAVIVATGARAWQPRLMNHVKVTDWRGEGILDAWPSPGELTGKAVAVIADTSDHLYIPDSLGREVAALCVIVTDDSVPDHLPVGAEGYGRPWMLKEVTGTRRLEKAVLQNERSGLIRTVAVDALIDLWGSSSSSNLFSAWGLKTVKHCLRVNNRMQTSLNRVYGAGDAVWYPGKVPGLAIGVAEAKRAVRSALRLR